MPENEEPPGKLSAKDQLEFLTYTAVIGKSYSNTLDFNKRAALWKKNDEFIKSNQNPEYELGHNKFSDWTDEERQALVTLKSPQNRLLRGSRCQAGQFFDGKACQFCAKGCLACKERTGICTLCAGNKKLISGKCQCINTFDMGDYCVDFKKCTDGYYLNATTNECLAGKVPYCKTYAERTGVCVTCINNMTLTNGQCACSAGLTLVNDTC